MRRYIYDYTIAFINVLYYLLISNQILSGWERLSYIHVKRSSSSQIVKFKNHEQLDGIRM